MLKHFKVLLGFTLIVFVSVIHAQTADSKDTGSSSPSAATAGPAAKQPEKSSVELKKEKRISKRQARQEKRTKKKAAREENKVKEAAAKEEKKTEKNKADGNP